MVSIESVNVFCGNKSRYCKQVKKDTLIFVREFKSLTDFRHLMNFYMSNIEASDFQYRLVNYEERLYLLIDINPKFEIGKRLFILNDRYEYLEDIIKAETSSRKGSFYNSEEIRTEAKKILVRLEGMGFLDTKINTSKKQENGKYDVSFNIDIGSALELKRSSVACKNKFIRRNIESFVSDFKNQVFDKGLFTEKFKNLKQRLFDYGYYFLDVNYKYWILQSNNVNLKITCTNERLVDFKIISKDKNINKAKFQRFIKKKLSGSLINVNFELQKIFKEYFTERGYLEPRVIVTKNIVKAKGEFGDIDRYSITIPTLEYIRVRGIRFRGNRYIGNAKLEDLARKFSTDLASVNKFDQVFYNLLKNKIKRTYIQQGFLSVKVDFGIERSSNGLKIAYDIKEGIQTVVKRISISGLKQPEIIDRVRAILEIRIGNFFDPVLFESRIKEIEAYLRSLGYYYANIADENDNSTVEYGPYNREVFINLNIKLGRKYYIENIYITGIRKTKRKIINRKIDFKKRSLLTPSLIKDINSRVASLGLFKKYSVNLIDRDLSNLKDILIQLDENDYGLVELAPGFRTDIGLKLSSKLSLLNLNGENQVFSVNGSVNQRISQSGIDSARESSEANLLEYSGKLNYSNPDIFYSYWDYANSLSFSKKRFYSFDAEILKMGHTFSKEYNDIVSFNLNYQLERISQFHATKIENNGRFRIGTLTPGIAFDFRDNPIRPTRGAFFDLSCEFAHPNFLSQNEKNLVFNFYKLVLRNRFYLPLGDRTVLAISAVAGVQKNLAREVITDEFGNTRNRGVIPSIKVFRLSGVDSVRGYGEDEINYIKSSGRKNDISTLTIDNKAYMSNIKIEPRYFFNDNAVLGVFLDGGTVQVDHFVPLELRASIGLSFKFYTPVGAFDVAYGHKLNRQKTSDGENESAGRFHFTIGFF